MKLGETEIFLIMLMISAIFGIIIVYCPCVLNRESRRDREMQIILQSERVIQTPVEMSTITVIVEPDQEIQIAQSKIEVS